MIDIFKQPLSEIPNWLKLPPITLAKLMRHEYEKAHQEPDTKSKYDIEVHTQEEANKRFIEQWKQAKLKERMVNE